MRNSAVAVAFLTLFVFLFLTPAVCSYGQKKEGIAHFTGSLSLGPNVYYNNIRVFRDQVKPVNYCFFGRIMWHSGYLVSMGIETGYNKYYRVNGIEHDPVKASLAAIPLHLVIGMRIRKDFYTRFSYGPSLLLNNASIAGVENNMSNIVFSLADVSLLFGYRKRLNKSFSVGAELKCSFSSKATDINLALPVVLSYDF